MVLYFKNKVLLLIQLSLFILLPLTSCKLEPSALNDTKAVEDLLVISNDSMPIPYHFDQHSQEIVLPSELVEISGLSYKNGDLLAINDELGKIYYIDKGNGEIKKSVAFGDNGDYEGVEVLSESVVVVQSDGTLYFQENEETRTVETIFKTKNDIEGLCFLAETNSLLLACKGSPLHSSKDKNTKSVYLYDLTSHELNETPYLEIKKEDLISFIETGITTKSDAKKKTKRLKKFSPSGIAINTLSNSLYILSARGSTMVVYDGELRLIDVIFLNEKRMPQPEGITFDENHNLYISTEGKSLLGKIYRYDFIKE